MNSQKPIKKEEDDIKKQKNPLRKVKKGLQPLTQKNYELLKILVKKNVSSKLCYNVLDTETNIEHIVPVFLIYLFQTNLGEPYNDKYVISRLKPITLNFSRK